MQKKSQNISDLIWGRTDNVFVRSLPPFSFTKLKKIKTLRLHVLVIDFRKIIVSSHIHSLLNCTNQ
jgi:hypothetical protein